MSYPLKSRITLAVSLLCFGLIVLSNWALLFYFEGRFHQSSLVHLSDALTVTARDFQEQLYHSQEILETIAQTLSHDILDDQERMLAFLEQQKTAALTFDNGLLLFSREGRLDAVSPLQPDVLGENYSFRDYYQVTADTLQPYISEPFRSRQAHQHPIIMLTVPILDEQEKLVAILGGSVDLFGDNFLKNLLTGSIGKNGFFVLLDQTNTLVMHPERELILKSGTFILPAEFFDNLKETSRGHIDVVDVSGQRMLAVFQHLAPIDWTLMALYPNKEVFAPVLEARRVSLGVMSLFLLITFFVVRALTDRLTAPLSRLAEQVRNVRDPMGPMELSTVEHYRELGDLADSIQFLVHNVNEKHQIVQDHLVFLQNLLETIPNPVFFKDEHSRYLGCNQRFEEFFGCRREDFLGKTVDVILPEDQAREQRFKEWELWQQGDQVSYESELTLSDGRKRYVVYYKKVFYLASGEPGGLIGTCIDITERRQQVVALENALQTAREASEKVNNILRSVSDGLIVTDQQKRVIHMNAIAEDVLGVQFSAVVGRRFPSLFRTSAIREQMRDFVTQHDLNGRSQEFEIAASDGGLNRVIQARSAKMQASNGQLLGLVTILRDVTHEREIDRIKSEFISIAAHELRTPITVILGYAELLLDAHEHKNFDESQQERFLHDIYRMGETLTRLVDDLLDISRIEAGLPLPLEKEPCQLAEIAMEVTQRFQAQNPRHRFEVQCAEESTIVADPGKLAQVFENLVSNAVKYSPKGGVVHVRMGCRDGKMTVCVSDEGIGMSEDQIKKMFDRFYRADSSNTAISGLGIGMSIVKSIIEGHNGTLEVTSVVGEGTRVCFTLPSGDHSDPCVSVSS